MLMINFVVNFVICFKPVYVTILLHVMYNRRLNDFFRSLCTLSLFDGSLL